MLEDRDAIPPFQEISVDQVDLSDDDRGERHFLSGYGSQVIRAPRRACARPSSAPAPARMKTVTSSDPRRGQAHPHHRAAVTRRAAPDHLGPDRCPCRPPICGSCVADEIRHGPRAASASATT